MEPKTLEELKAAIRKILSSADFAEDNYGQIIIYTDLAENIHGQLVDFESMFSSSGWGRIE